ncbi:MAG: hypothetical protein WDN69_04190 [Aliidongia sp.]
MACAALLARDVRAKAIRSRCGSLSLLLLFGLGFLNLAVLFILPGAWRAESGRRAAC